MAYTPPALNAVNFELVSFTPEALPGVDSALAGYSPPVLNLVDFVIGGYTQPSLPSVDFELGVGAPSFDGILKRWTGTLWAKSKLLTRVGGVWVSKPAHWWDGNSWKTIDISGV